jgi:hypothetical protein
MSQLKPIKYGDGKSILVEVEDTTGQDIEKLGRNKTGAIEQVGHSLEDVSVTIVETSQIMISAFESIASAPTVDQFNSPLVPSKATLEFGLRFSGEGSIYVVKAIGEATLKVTVEWNFQPHRGAGAGPVC